MSITLYTVEQVAAILKVNPAKVRDLINRGELKATRVGRLLRISEEELQAYIKRVTS